MRQIQVSAAMIHRDGKFYATRKAHGEGKGKWEFPGGKREEGESGEDTVIREIKEELGATVAVERKLCTITCQYPDFLLTMDCYLCHVTEGEPTLSEHDEAEWLTVDELDSRDWLEADEMAVKELKKAFSTDKAL